MSVIGLISVALLGLTSALLVRIAVTDLRHRQIDNSHVIAMLVLFLLYAAASGLWMQLHWHLALAAFAFVIMLVGYARKMMGGGDVKFLTVAFLWMGPWFALPFAILLVIFIGIHALTARLGWLPGEKGPKGLMIPLAPAASAAMIGVFLLGYARPL